MTARQILSRLELRVKFFDPVPSAALCINFLKQIEKENVISSSRINFSMFL